MCNAAKLTQSKTSVEAATAAGADLDMPPLVGCERQIQWGADLRARAVLALLDVVKGQPDTPLSGGRPVSTS